MKKLSNIIIMALIILSSCQVHAQLQLCLKDLVPVPTNDQSITVFKKQGGSESDNQQNSYSRVAKVWCNGFYSNGQVTGGTIEPINDSHLGQVRSLQITLPPITWGVMFNSSSLLSVSNITCKLFRSGESTPVQTLGPVTVQRAAISPNAKTAQYTTRGTRTVYHFGIIGYEDACWVRTFDPLVSGQPLPVDEKDYVVKVDVGNTLAECNSTNTAENNSKTYSYKGSTRVGDQNNSLEAADQSLQIQLFPNPAENEINLKIESPESDLTIEIINTAGMVVKNQSISIEERIAGKTINISKLPKGMYMMRVTGEDVTAVKRFIKN